MQIIEYDPSKPIDMPGIYRMEAEHYHADPCATPSLSASVLKKALPLGVGTGTPRHMRYAHPKLSPIEVTFKGKAAMDMGSAFHAMILQKGGEIEIIDAADWRTNAAKEAREAAYEAGRLPLLKEQFKAAKEMHRSTLEQMNDIPDLMAAMRQGEPELVYVWVEETPYGPIFCRAMMDWTPTKGDVFPDWKTTAASASPDAYGRTLYDMGGDIQDGFYRRGIKALLDRRAHLIFPCVEQYAPHAMAVHRIDPEGADVARRKVQWAINMFALCLREDFWPGYPTEIAWQAPPPWHVGKWEQREDQGMADTSAWARLIAAVKSNPPLPETLGFDPGFAADFDLPEKGG